MPSFATRDNIIAVAFYVLVMVGCYAVELYRIAHQGH